MSNWIDGYQVWLSESDSLHNAQIVANHFGGTDWSPEAISALCGNMRHESSINPEMYEYGYDWADDRGYGLVQWTPRSKYANWASANGLPIRDGDSQLARIDYEVQNNIQWIPIADYGYMTFADFRANTGGWSVAYLTEAFTWSYERPNRTAGQNSMSDRKAFASRAFAELDFSGSGGSAPAFPTEPYCVITSSYGWRTSPIDGSQDFHGGTDFAPPGGENPNPPIYATQSGLVVWSRFNETMGYSVRIDHDGDEYYSQYLHMRDMPMVALGETVTKGQQIGIMGTTGSSTGVHLHFAISTDGVDYSNEAGTIDPEEYLAMTFGGGEEGNNGEDVERQQYNTILAGRNTNMRREWRRK